MDTILLNIHLKKSDKNRTVIDFWYGSSSWPNVLTSTDSTIVKVIKLHACVVNDTNIKILVNRQWPQLSHLNLYGNNITSIGIQQFICQKWPQLQSITISYNEIKDEGMIMILEHFKNKLTHLNLQKCGITYVGIQTAINYNLSNLKKLYLSSNIIGNRGAKYLTKINLQNLEVLHLRCEIYSQGAKHLVKGKWPKLQQFYFTHYEDSLSNWQLISQNQWKKLKRLEVYEIKGICWMQVVLINSASVKMLEEDIRVWNKQLATKVSNALLRKDLFQY